MNGYQFFLKHAGFAYTPGIETAIEGRRRGAKALVKAERWAEAEGLEFVTRDDDEVAYCYCDDETCGYHEGSELQWETVCVALVRPCPEHGTDCRHAETLASLCGIIAPTSEYLRVVKAELALEAQR